MLLKKKFESNIMKLTLEPSRSMKITEEKITYYFLLDKGFTDNEIEYIKNKSLKEGVKYCVKTFAKANFEKVKIKLRKHLECKKFDELKNLLVNFIDEYPKNLTLIRY